MYALVIAALISTPSVEWEIELVIREQLRVSSRAAWIALGVMEPDEYYFSSAWTVYSDNIEMRERLEQIKPDTPPVDAQHFLPSRELAMDNWRDGYLYIQWLNEDLRPWLVEGPETEALEAVIAEAEARRKVWGQICDCRANWTGAKGRRLLLGELKQMVGADNFYAGRWPDPLPVDAYRDKRWQQQRRYNQ